MGLEGFVLLGFGGDQGVKAAQAGGDAVLFGELGSEYPHRREQTLVDNRDRLPAREQCNALRGIRKGEVNETIRVLGGGDDSVDLLVRRTVVDVLRHLPNRGTDAHEKDAACSDGPSLCKAFCGYSGLGLIDKPHV